MRRTLLVAFAAAVASTPAWSQGQPPTNPQIFRPEIRLDSAAPPNRDLGAVIKKSSEIDDMMAALRDLVVAQETYFTAHDSYTTDDRALDIFPTKHGQVQTHVSFASRDGWTGTATEPSLKGKNCVMYVGLLKSLPHGAPKTLGGKVATGEGVPACDEP
jgi:hypothetical protein